MRPIGYVGVILIVAGAIILAMGGMSYTKDKNQVDIGPLHVAAVEKGFVPPMYGLAAVIVGAALLVAGKRRRA